jgi:hypothetical protein
MSGVTREPAPAKGVVRVLLADLPDLQADVLAALVGQEPDMVVVGRVVRKDGHRRFTTSLRKLAPDVVVLPRADGPVAADVMAGLAVSPEVGVITLDERSGMIARVTFLPDGDSWPAGVIDTIRTAAPP